MEPSFLIAVKHSSLSFTLSDPKNGLNGLTHFPLSVIQLVFDGYGPYPVTQSQKILTKSF